MGFPVNEFMSFLCVLLALNFSPDMQKVYMKTCVCCNSICKYYCLRAAIPKSRHQIANYDDDDAGDANTLQVKKTLKEDDEDDEEDNPYKKRSDDDDDSDSDDSEQGALRGNHTAAYSTAMNEEI